MARKPSIERLRHNLNRPAGPPAKCPSWLPREAKAEWRRLSAELAADGRLTGADTAAFAVYCIAVGRLHQVAKQIAADGLVIDGPRGAKVKHPLASIELQLCAEVRNAGDRFGLSPASRGRAAPIPPSEENDSFDDFLNGKGVQN